MVIALLIIVALGFWLAEKFWPASRLPRVHGWWARVAVVNATQLGVVLLAGITWDRWFSRASLFNISESLNPVWAGTLAYFVSCVVYYWWHRVRHESGFFWRLCHQLHHSPRRLEVLTSFYKHPVEITLNSILSSAIVFLLLGCDFHGAAVYTFLTGAAEYFYHWNVRTPRWLGWFFQRPESHRVHHEYQRHTKNYADLPILDWLFGTLENPKRFVRRCGFTPRREAQFGSMLLFNDVHQKTAERAGLMPTCFGCRKRWLCQAVSKNT